MTDPTSTEIIIKAMRILADDIQTDDGVANSAILQAATRLEAQAKEIGRLKNELKKARSKQADDDCKLCNWTCQKCGEYVEPENVTFIETHEGCGGICL